jgi:Protein of unknown function (DUF3995)
VTAIPSRGHAISSGSWAAYAAAIWALAFAILHVVWATGWYVGLNQDLAREAFQQRWFLIYDLVVALVCALGVAVALALVQPWGRQQPRWVIGALAWSGTALLVLRGGAGAFQTAHIVATAGRWSPRSTFWEIWFCVGAILFGLSTWRFWRATRLPRDARTV